MDQSLSDNFVQEARILLKQDQKLYELALEYGIDYAGKNLNRRVEPDVDSASELPYWQKLKHEIYELFCTNTPKYSDIRKKIKEGQTRTERYGIPAVAVAIGQYLGIEAGLLTPFISLLVLSIAKVGIQAWCRGQGSVPFMVEGEPIKLERTDIEDNAGQKHFKKNTPENT